MALVERQVFARYVREVLAHLGEPAYLESHPLAELLAEDEGVAPSDVVRRAIVTAVEQLRPADTVAPGSPAWRGHRHLVLRYVQGETLNRTARELEISVRQARRDHDAAVAALESVLWQRYEGLGGATTKLSQAGELDEEGSPDDLSTLETELARIGRTAPEGYTDVEEIVRGTLATIGNLAKGRRVAIESSIPDTLSPVVVNQVALRQILLGLLGYAIELDAGTQLELTAHDAPVSVVVCLSVKKRTGASEGDARLASVSEEALALLSASRKLLQMQGGTLQVQSPSADGLFVTLELPAAPISTILVVDDNPDVVRLFRRYLKGRGYRLINAGEARRALALARDVRPAAIILDVLMPSLDGWQVLQELRAREETRSIPVIVCSVLPERQLANSLGVACFLPKPITRQTLLTALDQCSAEGR